MTHPPPSKRKGTRKPRPHKTKYGWKEPIADLYGACVQTKPVNLWPDECRDFAAWLLKAAEYLESKHD